MTAIPPAVTPPSFEQPDLTQALVNESVWVKEHGSNEETESKVFLVTGHETFFGNIVSHPRGYNLSSPKPFYVVGGGSGHGSIPKELYKGYALDFVGRKTNGELVFAEPPPDEAQYVVIKVIRRHWHDALMGWRFEEWGAENPYNEIAAERMLNPACETNHHSIGCIDALKNSESIFIVTPLLVRGDLDNYIPFYREDQLSEATVKRFFRKLVVRANELHSLGVVHCDIKGSNIGVVDSRRVSGTTPSLADMDPVFIDFAQSRRVHMLDQGVTHLMPPTPRFGTILFQPPEVFSRLETNPYGVDVWELGVVLFNLLTGKCLYLEPFDMLYSHFITNHGLVDTQINEAWLDVLQDPAMLSCIRQLTAPQDRWMNHLLELIPAAERLGADARNLLHGMLNPNIHQRFTLEQVLAHPWMQVYD